MSHKTSDYNKKIIKFAEKNLNVQASCTKIPKLQKALRQDFDESYFKAVK